MTRHVAGLARRVARTLAGLAMVAGCAREFVSDPPLAIEVVPRGAFPTTLSVGESRVVEVVVRLPQGSPIIGVRADWRSSSEGVLRVTTVPVVGTADSAAVDSLSARRLRMMLSGVDSGTATITVSAGGTGTLAPSEQRFVVGVRPLALNVTYRPDTLAVSQTDTLSVSLSGPPTLRLAWRSTDPSKVRVDPLPFVGNPIADSLASRQRRMRVVASEHGSADLIATMLGEAGPSFGERRIRVTVLPLQIQPEAWPDTVSVADSLQLRVRITDTRGRAVQGLSIEWRSSDAGSLALSGPATLAPVPSGTVVRAAALRRDSVRVSLSIVGVPASEAATLVVPIRVMERWIDLTVGEANTCALSSDGRPYCWGNQFMGGGHTEGGGLPRDSIPARVNGRFQDAAIRFRRLSGGPWVTCGESDSSLRLWSCWGDDFTGLITGLGGGPGNRWQPYAVPLAFTGVPATDVFVGGTAACSANDFGNALHVLFCWGTQMAGIRELFIDPARCGAPGLACASFRRWIGGAAEVALAHGFTCASGPRAGASSDHSFTSNSAGCWAAGNAVAMGHGTLAPFSLSGTTDATVRPLASPVSGSLRSLAATRDVICALAPTGAAHCWGKGLAAPVVVPSAVPFREIVGSGDSSDDWLTFFGGDPIGRFCGVTVSQGTAMCWRPGAWTPVAEAPGVRNITKLRISGTHSCAIVGPSGALTCWGGNWNGQLGRGARSPRQLELGPLRVREPPGRP